MTEHVRLPMLCLCGERKAIAEEIRGRHEGWGVSHAFYELNAIAGPVTIYSDQWFALSSDVEWVREDGEEREFRVRLECDEVEVGAMHLYDELMKMWLDWTGEAWVGLGG